METCARYGVKFFAHAPEIRRGELKHALAEQEGLKDDTSSDGVIVKSNARDARHPSHCRDFRTVEIPLSPPFGFECWAKAHFRHRELAVGCDVSAHHFSKCGEGGD